MIRGWHVDVEDEYGAGQTRIVVVTDPAGSVLLYMTTSRGWREVLAEGGPSDLPAVQAEADRVMNRMRSSSTVVSIRELTGFDSF